MSELAMTVVAGPSHPNSGQLSAVHVFGGLYIGGSGAWRFGSVANNIPPSGNVESVFLASDGRLIHELRAGIALSLGLGDSHRLVEDAAGPDWRDQSLTLAPEILIRLGDESRGRSVAVIISTLDAALAHNVEPHVADAGWSVVLCGPVAEHLETQWDA